MFTSKNISEEPTGEVHRVAEVPAVKTISSSFFFAVINTALCANLFEVRLVTVL